ncbi:MAG TPA: hypothetical protein VFR86_09520, partial [Burkholderiaceae bacterium]|nr:hypothetical protein [Burkholderiaceae bacterium]
ADPPAAQRIEAALSNLRQAFADDDAPRMARELARLQKAGGDPLDAVRQAIVWSHDRLEDGTTHAYAAAAGWLQLRDEVAEEDARLVCLAEAIGHMAWDTLRRPLFPYPHHVARYDARSFLQAIEERDEVAAVAQLRGALADGAHFATLEPAFARAALAHYAGFGHAAIYVVMTGRLIARLGDAVEAPLLVALTRHLVRTRREDLIPDFRGYAQALAAWPTATAAAEASGARGMATDVAATAGAAGKATSVAAAAGAPGSATNVAAADAPGSATALAASAADAGPGAPLVGASIKKALAHTLDRAACDAPSALHRVLLDAAALQLLRFDARYEHLASENVADNIGWLDFTHALTFGNAVRVLCSRVPELWPQGLLQIALFVGRNGGFLDAEPEAEVQRWHVADAAQFDAACRAQILDHGIEPPIYPAHWLKTWLAMREEIAAGAPLALAAHLRAAVNRFLHAPLKQKNALGYARQALRFVARED